MFGVALLLLDSILAGAVGCNDGPVEFWLTVTLTAMSLDSFVLSGVVTTIGDRLTMKQGSIFQFVCIVTFSHALSSICSRSSSSCRTNHHR